MSKMIDTNGLVSDLFRRLRDLPNRRSERIFIAIRAVLFCGVDELLALGARVWLFNFGFGHYESLAYLLAYREVCHV